MPDFWKAIVPRSNTPWTLGQHRLVPERDCSSRGQLSGQLSNRFKADLVAFGMLPRDVLTIAIVTTGLVVIVTSGAPTNLDPEDYEMLADNGARSIDKGNVMHLFL